MTEVCPHQLLRRAFNSRRIRAGEDISPPMLHSITTIFEDIR